MAPDTGYPVSIIKQGPTFRDELRRQPQEILTEESVESLRIVPAKSAASGVYTIYFMASDREWALVRLATRYRWLFEIQLNRGMSGERQMMQQGFTPDDLDFLFDIIPAPPTEYNPIVYDMLWLVATYDAYRALTEAMVERDQFTPAELFAGSVSVDESKIGYLTRFLRSHLIQPVDSDSRQIQSHEDASKADLKAEVGEAYEATADGQAALKGILAEYERIFETAEFDPLLINPELDPQQHLKEYDSELAEQTPTMSFNEIQDEGGILGNIASSFSSFVDEAEGETDSEGEQPPAGSTSRTASTEEKSQTTEKQSGGESDRGDGVSTSPTPVATGDDDETELITDMEQREEPVDSAERGSEREFGDYTADEVLAGAVAAASYIHDQRIARTQGVKKAVWDAVSVGDRDRSDLWEYVTQVLLMMDSVDGRPGGKIWTAL